MDKQPTKKAASEESGTDTTGKFTDTMHKLLAVPKEDMARREDEWRKANPKKTKPKKQD